MAVYRVQRIYSDVYQKEFGAFSRVLEKTKSALKKLNPGAKIKDAKMAQEIAEEELEAALKSRDKWKKIALGTSIGAGGAGLGFGGGYLVGSNKKKK